MREVQPRWRVAVLLCTNDRGPGSPKASCGVERGRELRRWLRDRAGEVGLRDDILVSTTGCLGICSPRGHTAVVIADGGREVMVIEDVTDREGLWRRVRATLPDPGA